MLKLLNNYPRGFAAVLILAVIAVLIVGGFGLSKLLGSPTGFFGKNSTITPAITPKACTLEVKICPDGSAVSRVAPDCNFALCPGSSAASPTPAATCLTCQTKVSNESLDSDLKDLDTLDSSLSSGLSGVDGGLNDKGDNLAE